MLIPLCDDELVLYNLIDLDDYYNPFFTTTIARVDLIMPSELYSQLLSFNHHTNLQTIVSSIGSSSATLVVMAPVHLTVALIAAVGVAVVTHHAVVPQIGR
jgi:hypothetical protein